MTKTSKLLLALILGCCALSAQAKVMESSVATINGKPVLASDYDAFLDGVIEQYKATQPQALERPYATDILGKQVLAELISKELLSQAAEEQKIVVKDSELDEAVNEIKTRFAIDDTTGQPILDPKTKQPDMKAAEKKMNEALKKQGLTLKTYRAKLSKEVAVRKLMEQRLREKVVPPQEADARALFDQIQAVLNNDTKKLQALEKESPEKLAQTQAIAAKLKQLTAEKVRIGHIYLALTKDMTEAQVKEKEKLAKKIKKQIDGGKNFNEAVKEYTEDKQALAATGGDMILIKGVAPKEIDEKAFTLSVGKVSEPIKTDVGYHIIKIKEKSAEQTVEFEDIANDLMQFLQQERVQRAMAEYVEELYSKADIKVTKEFELDKYIAQQQAAQKGAAQKTEENKEVKK